MRTLSLPGSPQPRLPGVTWGCVANITSDTHGMLPERVVCTSELKCPTSAADACDWVDDPVASRHNVPECVKRWTSKFQDGVRTVESVSVEGDCGRCEFGDYLEEGSQCSDSEEVDEWTVQCCGTPTFCVMIEDSNIGRDQEWRTCCSAHEDPPEIIRGEKLRTFMFYSAPSRKRIFVLLMLYIVHPS